MRIISKVSKYLFTRNIIRWTKRNLYFKGKRLKIDKMNLPMVKADLLMATSEFANVLLIGKRTILKLADNVRQYENEYQSLRKTNHTKLNKKNLKNNSNQKINLDEQIKLFTSDLRKHLKAFETFSRVSLQTVNLKKINT